MISAILLAAGTSRRMGSNNKLLLPWQGKPMVAATAANLLKAGLEDIIVVTGYEAPLITAALKTLPLHILYNPDFETGMTSSIRTGVREATGKGYMICLADMALITAIEYKMLIKAWEEHQVRDGQCIGIPSYKGTNGNPIIYPKALRQAILTHEEKDGCAEVIRKQYRHHCCIDMPTDHILTDIDRPEQYVLLSDH